MLMEYIKSIRQLDDKPRVTAIIALALVVMVLSFADIQMDTQEMAEAKGTSSHMHMH